MPVLIFRPCPSSSQRSLVSSVDAHARKPHRSVGALGTKVGPTCKAITLQEAPREGQHSAHKKPGGRKRGAHPWEAQTAGEVGRWRLQRGRRKKTGGHQLPAWHQ